MLAGLPALGLLLGTALGADPLHVLLHTGPGWAVCWSAGCWRAWGCGGHCGSCGERRRHERGSCPQAGGLVCGALAWWLAGPRGRGGGARAGARRRLTELLAAGDLRR